MWSRAQAIENYNYWNDTRVINSMVQDDCFFVKGSSTQINMAWVEDKWEDWAENEEIQSTFKEWLEQLGGSATLQYETKFEICPTCNGRGTHTNPNIDCGGITASEWEEWDPEERDHYMNGGYDVTCSHCHGKRVIQHLEYDTQNPLYNWCSERLAEHYEYEYEYAQERANELRWGC